ncbi:MAG: YicC/YloC family endoribonuclease [Planctomycetales bacterium]
MLLSMTGFGEARLQNEQFSLTVEIRTVNNRYFKLNSKLPDAYAPFEPEIERVVRETISRGTVSLAIRKDRAAGGNAYSIDQVLLASYFRQVQATAAELKFPHDKTLLDLIQLASLPGVIREETDREVDLEREWQSLKQVLEDALQKLAEFRKREGAAMRSDLELQAGVIRQRLSEVETRAPQVVAEYRQKLLERVRQALAEADVTLSESDLIREVSIFSDRCDINEEITRLKCHLDQLKTFLGEEAANGRKLDFLTQEIFREVNTIGSKAYNVEIAHAVVDMKSAVERIREIVQNVE